MSWYHFLAPTGEQNINFLLSRKVWWAVRNGSFCPKLRYFTDQKGPKRGPHQNEFWLFSNTKVNVKNREEKVDEKNGIVCLVLMFPSWVMVLKLSKKVHFMQFCADLSQKFKFVEAIYTYASEGFRAPLPPDNSHLGQFPPDNSYLEQLPPDNFHLGQLPPGKFSRTILI